MERGRSTAQRRVEKDLSRRELLSVVGDQVRVALLAHAQAGSSGELRNGRRELSNRGKTPVKAHIPHQEIDAKGVV